MTSPTLASWHHPSGTAPWNPTPQIGPYGAAPVTPAAAAPTAPGSAAYVTQAAQAYATYEASRDPRMMLGVYKARIQNYKAMKAKYPFLSGFYDSQIAILRAKVDALEQSLSIKVEGEQATRDWRSLGQSGVAIGVIGGVAVVVLLAAITARVLRG